MADGDVVLLGPDGAALLAPDGSLMLADASAAPCCGAPPMQHTNLYVTVNSIPTCAYHQYGWTLCDITYYFQYPTNPSYVVSDPALNADGVSAIINNWALNYAVPLYPDLPPGPYNPVKSAVATTSLILGVYDDGSQTTIANTFRTFESLTGKAQYYASGYSQPCCEPCNPPGTFYEWTTPETHWPGRGHYRIGTPGQRYAVGEGTLDIRMTVAGVYTDPLALAAAIAAQVPPLSITYVPPPIDYSAPCIKSANACYSRLVSVSDIIAPWTPTWDSISFYHGKGVTYARELTYGNTSTGFAGPPPPYCHANFAADVDTMTTYQAVFAMVIEALV